MSGVTLTIRYSGGKLYIRMVMTLNIVKATRNDSGNIMELIKACILDMESVGIYQWNEHYPKDYCN